MKSHKNKIIAPIVATVAMIIYYIVYFGFLMTLLSGFWRYALGIIPIVFAVVTVKVCIERIKEINGGEEDDLSKY